MLSELLALVVTRYFRKVYAVKVQVLGKYRKLVVYPLLSSIEHPYPTGKPLNQRSYIRIQ